MVYKYRGLEYVLAICYSTLVCPYDSINHYFFHINPALTLTANIYLSLVFTVSILNKSFKILFSDFIFAILF